MQSMEKREVYSDLEAAHLCPPMSFFLNISFWITVGWSENVLEITSHSSGKIGDDVCSVDCEENKSVIENMQTIADSIACGTYMCANLCALQ